MDCPLCNLSWSPILLRPLRYTICGACYEGARSVISFINKLQNYHEGGGGDNKSVNSSFNVSPQNPSKASFRIISSQRSISYTYIYIYIVN